MEPGIWIAMRVVPVSTVRIVSMRTIRLPVWSILVLRNLVKGYSHLSLSFSFNDVDYLTSQRLFNIVNSQFSVRGNLILDISSWNVSTDLFCCRIIMLLRSSGGLHFSLRLGIILMELLLGNESFFGLRAMLIQVFDFHASG